MNTVEFPGLWGLEIPVSRVAFNVYGIEIFWYGIIIAAAFMVAVLLGMKSSRKFGLEPDNVIDLLLFAAPVSIVFARLYYVIFSWENFKDNLLEIFNIRTGGLAIYGGIIGALLVAYIFGRAKKIGVLRLLDFGVPYLVLAQAIGRWGNFVNQEAFGTNTTLPWGMTSETVKSELMELQLKGMKVDPNMPVHPTFLYESVLDLAIFFILIWYRKRKKLDGEVFFLYMILYGAGRFFIEGIRTDSLYLGNLRVSQVLAFLFAVTFGIIFSYRRSKAGRQADEVVQTGTSKYGSILRKLQEDEAEDEAATAPGTTEGESSMEENADRDKDTAGETGTVPGDEGKQDNTSE